MIRGIFGAVLGAAAWFAVVFAVSSAIKLAAPDLGAALAAHVTPVALAERLAISFLASLAGGVVAALVAGEGRRAPLGTGAILLIVFVPYHLSIWDQFPIWYHLSFFVSLPLLSLIGGRIVRR